MKKIVILPLVLIAALLSGGATRIVQDQCGPFTDVTPAFCPYVLELYYLGITAGTSATTFSPDDPLTRGQGAAFVAKGLNQSLARSSRRAALGQWWTTTPQWENRIGTTYVGLHPIGIASDGADLWVANQQGNTVARVRASDGKLLETWTGDVVAAPTSVLVAMGKVFVTGGYAPGILFMIDPSQPAGPLVPVATVGGIPAAITFDGSRIWTANQGSVSIVTPGTTLPWSVATVATGFTTMTGALYDGQNVWVTDRQQDELLKLDSNGAILQTVVVGDGPEFPVFDGANIWVPNFLNDTVSIVQASTGNVLTTLTSVGTNPSSAAFDGQRVLIASYVSGVSLWRAADFAPLGSFPIIFGNYPNMVCSDGENFWVTLSGADSIGRF
jgi:DNA-binding beta-propeller fold protein YncE